MIASRSLKLNCACKCPEGGDCSETQQTWERRLALYAVASGALLGLPGTAQASIIANTLTTPVTVSSDGWLSLDLDGNGINDVLLSALAATGDGTVAVMSGVVAEGLNGTLIGADSGGFYAAPVVGPGMIAGVADWSDSATLTTAVTLYNKSAQTKTGGAWTIENGSRHWFAAQFQLSSGATSTGWADVYAQAGRGSSQFTVYGTAYDDAPATATPEPCTMALFAAGSAGILAWRRRKAARQ